METEPEENQSNPGQTSVVEEVVDKQPVASSTPESGSVQTAASSVAPSVNPNKEPPAPNVTQKDPDTDGEDPDEIDGGDGGDDGDDGDEPEPACRRENGRNDCPEVLPAPVSSNSNTGTNSNFNK